MNRISAATNLTALLAGARATSAKWWFPPHRSISSTASGHNNSIIDKNRNTCERKVLPPELSRNTMELTCKSSADGGVCNVYLVGTAKRSPESCQQVKDVIKFLKPQVVFLELCDERAHEIDPSNPKGVGGEFRSAADEARKYGAKIILGDRPYEITKTRLFAKSALSPWPKFSQIRDLKLELNKMGNASERTLDEANSVIQALGELFPKIKEVYFDEREQYMSAMLLKVAREHNSVAAVVRKECIIGIRDSWKQPIDVKQLLEMPDTTYAFDREKATLIVGKVLVLGFLMWFAIITNSFQF